MAHPTLKSIAQETGYAVSTVSNVLNNRKTYTSEQARRAILDAAKRLNYRPNYFASALRRRESRVIGIAGSFLHTQISSRILRATVEALHARSYMAFLVDTWSEPQRERAAIEEFARKQVDGVILRTATAPDAIASAIPSGVPIVFHAEAPVPGFPTLTIDRDAATAAAVRRLAAAGHRRFAYLSSRLTSTRSKVAGFRDALAALGLDHASAFEAGSPDPAAAEAIVVANAPIFRSVTAILTSNDHFAAAAIHGLARIGRRVPADCAVVGFDDDAVAQATTPPLTTLRQPAAEAGAQLARMILQRIASHPVENVTLVPEWVERQSTAPAP